ncbi:MAG: hypothetical protein MR717_01865 [Prevotella sp.]|nr:hypothetical protein [Prevotella sp.]
MNFSYMQLIHPTEEKLYVKTHNGGVIVKLQYLRLRMARLLATILAGPFIAQSVMAW